MIHLRRWIAASPVAQFLLIGAVVATLHALLSDDRAPDAAAQGTIVMDAARLEQLGAQFERTWRRAPMPAELDGIVQAFVREEVLYRAGRSLGLGEEDPVIRRRIAQKMEFLLEPGPGEIEIDEAALADHLAANRERFREPARIALAQVFVDPARHGDALDAIVAALRDRLLSGVPAETLGERTMLPSEIGLVPVREIARVFGDVFVAGLDGLTVGRWSGPVASGFGLHFVRIDAREPPRDPPLSDVREAVRRDLEAERRDALAAERFDALRTRYTIVVEPLADDRMATDDAPAGLER